MLAFSFLKKHQKIKSALQARFKFPLVLKPIKCVDNFIYSYIFVLVKVIFIISLFNCRGHDVNTMLTMRGVYVVV